MQALLRSIGIYITLLGSVVPAYGQSARTYIPPQAHQYFPVIEREVDINLPTFYPTYKHYFAALIEQESCISLKHSRCWKPTSSLKTSREEGAGLSQITRAYRADGSLRFDTLSDLRRKYSTELKELSWDTIYQRPDLQIRAMVILSRENYKSLSIPEIEPIERIALTDAAYNGGLAGVHKERRVCGLSAKCNPDKWFGNVERYCQKSKKVLYGNRNACDINREHVETIVSIRMAKYKSYFGEPVVVPIPSHKPPTPNYTIVPIPAHKPALSIHVAEVLKGIDTTGKDCYCSYTAQ